MDRSYSPKTMVFVFALMGPKTFPFLMLKIIILNFDFAHCQNLNDIVGKVTPFTNKILVFVDEALFSDNRAYDKSDYKSYFKSFKIQFTLILIL